MVTKDRIIEVASKLFVQNGIKSITITRIVQELHTSKRTIYNHFKDKTELLESCLSVYHAKIKSENEELIKAASNAIEAMGYIHQRIIYRASQTNPNYFNDILHYYPGLLQKSYRKMGNFAHQQLRYIGEWGIEDGLFLEDIDLEVTSKTVLALLEMLKDNNRFPVSEFSKERLTFGIMLPYMRGVCTFKGMEILEQQKELYKVML
ncbi:MAG: TetR/AcrR family transcriptional regulator [Saprospiraceae bacterium]|nr:TetR/AcrR family transcriptional regulator [Saprospiraceae bacterium]